MSRDITYAQWRFSMCLFGAEYLGNR